MFQPPLHVSREKYELKTFHWMKKWICFKLAQRKYDANLCKLRNKSEQRW